MLQCNAIEKTFKAHHCDALVTPYHTVQNTCLALTARHSYLNLNFRFSFSQSTQSAEEHFSRPTAISYLPLPRPIRLSLCS